MWPTPITVWEEKGIPWLTRRVAAILLLGVTLIVGILAIFGFSRMNAPESNGLSKTVTASIQAWTDLHFSINPADSFWMQDLNNIVRKMGHVCEYALLGFIACSFLNVLLRNNYVAMVVSPVFCFGVACVDEYLQQFADGRGPMWRDVRLDTLSAFCGIVTSGIVFAVLWRMLYLKREALRWKTETLQWKAETLRWKTAYEDKVPDEQ